LDCYYELSGVGAEFDISLTVRECIHQIINARSKLKDVVNNTLDLRTQFEVDLAMAVVEHKMPEFRPGETFMECDKEILAQKKLKSREKRRTYKRSWEKLGREIRGHLKPHTLQKSKLTAVEVSCADAGSWSRIDTKEQVEALLINRNIEQFWHAGDTPFGYTPLGDELGHTDDTLMADDIYNGTLEHRSLTDHAIKAIVKQLCKHPLLTKMIYPVVTTEDFISCFGCVAEKTSSSPSGRQVGHYLAYIDLKDELSVLLTAVHAAMMAIPLAEGFCPERWRQAIDIMLEKIPGVPRINKLRIIQLLEADLNQVLRSVFARNISKLAQETPGIISEHQYGRSHQTCLTPVLNKLLTVQLLIQKKTNGIVLDNDAKGCYDRIVSGIALAEPRRIVYSKNSVRMLGLLWAQLEHHVETGFGVSDASYKSTMEKLLYDIGQGSCSSPIVWALLTQLLLTALGEEFNCISLVSVDGITTDTHPGDSFVDDTTTGATDDNHNLKPIPSTVRGITQEEDSLVARMEIIEQFFLDLLQATGGDFALEKCAWYLIGHRWSKGVSKLIQIEPQHRSITMTSRSSG
jgi:hypothetical protein